WFRVKHHIRDPKQQLEKKKLVAFWLEHYAKRDHGKPLTVVFDMSETGISHIDLDFVRFIVNCFTDYYPNFLTKIVIFEMPWIMNAAFKIVKGWLGPDAISMLKFTNKSDVQEYISGEYLPPHMGGTVSILTFHGPFIPSFSMENCCSNSPASYKNFLTLKKAEIAELQEWELKEGLMICRVESILFSSVVIFFSMVCHIDNLKKLTLLKFLISPAEELYFGSKETGEKKCLIVLTNVTKNIVAFKVRTTAPEKYRVKPSNSSCEPGTSLDIIVSLHGGFAASLQDRFLIMAAEMDQSSGAGVPELTQFWKEVPRTKVMEHRLRCHVVESSKPFSLTLKESAFNIPAKTNEDLHIQLTHLLQINKRLQEQIDRCLWFQQLSIVLSLLSVTVVAFCFYLVYTQRS
ncbi:MSPD2 protein, partial [Eolophus roseicapillus]|nr:MSPD2 protein [Eolophus roseicapilla]